MRGFALVVASFVVVGCGGSSVTGGAGATSTGGGATPVSTPPDLSGATGTGGGGATGADAGTVADAGMVTDGGTTGAGADGGTTGAGADGGTVGDGGVGGDGGTGGSACALTKPESVGLGASVAVDTNFIYSLMYANTAEREITIYREQKSTNATETPVFNQGNDGEGALLENNGNSVFLLWPIGSYQTFAPDFSTSTTVKLPATCYGHAIVAGNLYCTDYATGNVYAVSLATGVATTMYTGSSTTGQSLAITSDGAFVYVAESGSIIKVSVTPPYVSQVLTALTTSVSNNALLADGHSGNLYFGDTQGTVWMMPSDGSAAPKPIAVVGLAVDLMFASKGHIWVASSLTTPSPYSLDDDELVTMDRDGTNIVQQQIHDGLMLAMVDDGTYVYWVDSVDSIWRLCD